MCLWKLCFMWDKTFVNFLSCTMTFYSCTSVPLFSSVVFPRLSPRGVRFGQTQRIGLVAPCVLAAGYSARCRAVSLQMAWASDGSRPDVDASSFSLPGREYSTTIFKMYLTCHYSWLLSLVVLQSVLWRDTAIENFGTVYQWMPLTSISCPFLSIHCFNGILTVLYSLHPHPHRPSSPVYFPFYHFIHSPLFHSFA